MGQWDIIGLYCIVFFYPNCIFGTCIVLYCVFVHLCIRGTVQWDEYEWILIWHSHTQMLGKLGSAAFVIVVSFVFVFVFVFVFNSYLYESQFVTHMQMEDRPDWAAGFVTTTRQNSFNFNFNVMSVSVVFGYFYVCVFVYFCVFVFVYLWPQLKCW